MILNIVHLGLIDYEEALNVQKKLVELCRKNTIDDTLLLLEHPPVLTMGTRAQKENIYLTQQQLKAYNVKVYDISRGGDVTYHGPGQIVGYPIFNLMRHGKDIKGFVGKILDVFIKLLEHEFSISSYCEHEKHTGVWIANDKILAIGIAIQHWVSMHGFAFNVNTDLSHFLWINPCGLTDRGVTSLQKLTGMKQDIDNLYHLIKKYFCEVFDMEANICSLENLIG